MGGGVGGGGGGRRRCDGASLEVRYVPTTLPSSRAVAVAMSLQMKNFLAHHHSQSLVDELWRSNSQLTLEEVRQVWQVW